MDVGVDVGGMGVGWGGWVGEGSLGAGPGGWGSGGGVPPRAVPRQGAYKAWSEHTKERRDSERASGSAGKRGA